MIFLWIYESEFGCLFFLSYCHASKRFKNHLHFASIFFDNLLSTNASRSCWFNNFRNLDISISWLQLINSSSETSESMFICKSKLGYKPQTVHSVRKRTNLGHTVLAKGLDQFFLTQFL
jgi:hypothetical protein